MQIFSNDKIVTSDTIQDLKECNQQSLTTQARKGEQLVSMILAIKKSFVLLSVDIVDLSRESDAIKKIES